MYYKCMIFCVRWKTCISNKWFIKTGSQVNIANISLNVLFFHTKIYVWIMLCSPQQTHPCSFTFKWQKPPGIYIIKNSRTCLGNYPRLPASTRLWCYCQSYIKWNGSSPHLQSNWKGLYLSSALVTFPLATYSPEPKWVVGLPNWNYLGQDNAIICVNITSL